MNQADLLPLAATLRPPFLLLTPACSVLGLGSAFWTSGHINMYYFLAALAGALFAHISVNTLNEYHDFRSGLDFKTIKTPFSGGSGALPSHPLLSGYTLIIGVTTFIIAMSLGSYLSYVNGMAVLPLGILGLIIIAAYNIRIVRSTILSLIAPGLGFGTIMVIGTGFVVSGQYSWTLLWTSLVPFFMVNNLLLLNQFPDVEADRGVGRENLPISIGRCRSAYVFVFFMCMSYLSIILGMQQGQLPASCAAGLITAVVALPLCMGVLRHADDIQKLLPYMGLNIIVTLVTPVLLAVGLFIG